MNELLIPVIVGLTLVVVFIVIGIVDVNANGFKDLNDEELIGDSINVKADFPYKVYYDKDKFKSSGELEVVKITNG